MNHKHLLSLYGLKWNPFGQDIPPEGLASRPQIDTFSWRIEQMAKGGGFALLTGDPGTGKSAALRSLNKKLREIRDINVTIFSRPQSRIGDFYRELGNLYGIELKAHNAYGGFQSLRERWQAYCESSLIRPVILIDEAQEMPTTTLSELRLLSSSEFDSKNLLTIIFCSDRRLTERFRHPDLLPVGSRIKVRLLLEPLTRDEMIKAINELISKAGNPNLMTQELIQILADHSLGNFRVMTTMATDLLIYGIAKEVQQLDEALFFEVFNNHQPKKKPPGKGPNNENR